MNEYFYGDSFGRLSLLDEVNIWKEGGYSKRGAWYLALSVIRHMLFHSQNAHTNIRDHLGG